jgi:hypothetical protein
MRRGDQATPDGQGGPDIMAKLFKGKLPSDQREMTIVEIEGGETMRSWREGMDRRQALNLMRGVPLGTHYTVRNVICAEGGRGDVVRELRVLTDGIVYRGGTDMPVPVDYR